MLKIELFIYRHVSLCLLGSRHEERQKRNWDEWELQAAGGNVGIGVLFGVLMLVAVRRSKGHSCSFPRLWCEVDGEVTSSQFPYG